MFNIIKSDFYRIFRGKAIYICLIIVAASIIVSTYEFSPGWIGVSNSLVDSAYDSQISEEDEGLIFEANSLKEEREIMKKYPYALDKAIVGANANFYYLFVVILVILLSTDFSNSTVKNTISSAISRKKYYLSKLISSLLLCTLFILFANYGAYFTNLWMNGNQFSSSLVDIIKVTLYQLPLMYGIISLLVCICVAVRKTAVFNTIAIPLLVVFQLLLMLVVNVFKLDSNIVIYEYQVALNRLVSDPTNAYLLKCTLLGVGYIVLFNLAGYYLFKKAEIK